MSSLSFWDKTKSLNFQHRFQQRTFLYKIKLHDYLVHLNHLYLNPIVIFKNFKNIKYQV